MIDIHTHILPGVDDGSPSEEASIEMLREEERFGVTDVFLTPHYMKSRGYLRTYDENKTVFEQFSMAAKKAGISIQLHLGNEIYYTFSSIQALRDQTVAPMGNTPAVLIEFSTSEEDEEIPEAIHNIVAMGYTPVIAHVERYSYIKTAKDYEVMRKMGALIQINAAAIVGAAGPATKKFVWKLLKSGLIDVIASDIHVFRTNYMKEAYDLILKKFGQVITERLFNHPIFAETRTV
ncbi:MAG: hypothetical protein PHP32_01020 [Candidatus Izemoplasmatales bacterium]|nr:hypothetical protein [Candidatus Izemoplasmatales bacterium]